MRKCNTIIKSSRYIFVFALLILFALIVFLSFTTLDNTPAHAADAISNASQLSSAIRGGSGSYELTNNITWSSCGRNEANTFTGTLDGKGYTITLNTGYTSRTSTGTSVNIGLMVAALSGTIKNCTIVLADNPYLYEYTGSSKNYTNYCGIIAGALNASAVLDNVHIIVNGSISYYAEDTSSSGGGGYGIMLGGFAGRSYGGTIKNSSVTVNGAIYGKAEDYDGNNDEGTSSRAHVGGFVGETQSGTLTITDCALYGSTNGVIGAGAINSKDNHKSDRAGGIVGVVRGGTALNINGILYDYNGGVTVTRTNDDCGLFIGKIYGSMSASNIVKSSTCSGYSFVSNVNTRQVTSIASVNSSISVIQNAGYVINIQSVGSKNGSFSNTILYNGAAFLGGTASSSYGTFKITNISDGNYKATISASSNYTPSAIQYGSSYFNCYSSYPTKGSSYTAAGIPKASTIYQGFVAAPSYGLTASYINKTYDGSGGTFTIYPDNATAAFTNNVYLYTTGTPGNTISSVNSNTVATNKNVGTYTCMLTNSSGSKLANNALLYANASNAPSAVCYYAGQTYTLTISQRTATLVWANTSFTYDGVAHTPTASVSNIVSGDTCTVTVSGSGTNAGTYTATATALSNSNYTLPSAKTTNFTINKREISLSWSNTAFTYDKTPHQPIATAGNLVSGTSCEVTVTGAQTNAGTYTATATAVSNGNYTLPAEKTYNFVINPKTVGLTWQNTSFVYDGLEHCATATATGIISGDSCAVTVSGNKIAVGTHTATATALSNGNYTLPSAKTGTFTITPRTATLSWSNTTLTYQKSVLIPTASVSNLVFSDTCIVTVSANGVNIGTHTATATALSNSNYALPANPVSNYQIVPFTVTLSWTNTTPVYNGYNQIPVAIPNNFAGDTCVITVAGERSQAGTGYEARAVAVSNANYKLPAAVTTAWSILPKGLTVGFWQSSIAASYTFTGSRIFPTPIVTDNLLGLLVNNKDYTIAYDENYSVNNGGKVYVTGLNNYKDQTEVTFNITKAEYNVFFASLRYNSVNVGLETLKPQNSEFEAAFDASMGYAGNYITVYGYTDAIYPDLYNPSSYEPKQLLFSVSSNVDIQYLQNRIVKLADGKYYSETTARIYLSRDISSPSATVQYGITTITLGASNSANYNPNAVNYINRRLVEDNYEAELGNDTTPLQHRIFIKKNHIAGGSFVSDIVVTYGDPVFDIKAGLNSGLYDYTVTSSNQSLLTVATDSNNLEIRKAAILNAGELELSLFHPGISDLDTPANSYISVNAKVKVTINRAVLTVTPIKQTVIYGTMPYYDKTSFIYGGFKNSDGINIIKSVKSGHDPITMRDVGTYYLTASDVILADSQYQNYDFEYPDGEGILVIIPKTLYAQIIDQVKVYGEDNPLVTITYQGFIAGESEDNAADFAPPAVDFNGVHSLTPKGSYTINLRGGSARNYTIDISDTAKFTINRALVKIELDNKTTDYNAKSVYSQTPVVIGVQGGTIPLGYTTVYYLYGESYASAAPVNVGEYDVMVVYSHGGEEDNYDITTVYFTQAVNIEPIAPIFILESVILDYNTMAYGGVPGSAKVEKGVEGGTDPSGTLSFLYSREGGDFTSSLPRNSGRYTVKVIYSLIEGIHDNYINGSYYEFADAVTIQKIDVTIELASVIAAYTSSDGISPDRVYANEAMPYGVYSEINLNKAIYPYELSYRYLIEGVWTESAPYNAGKYAVEVTFNPDFEINYNRTVLEFQNAIKIEGAMPKLSLNRKEISYNGKRVAPNSAEAKGILGGSAPTGTFQYLFLKHGSNENFSSELAVINVNLVNGVNLGYDVLVRYISGTKDNYADYEERFDSSLIVLPITPRITLAPVSVNFTGAMFDFSRITASVSGILNGSLPLGTLSYEFVSSDSSVISAPINSGTYSVKVTFTPATYSNNNTHGNYTAVSSVFANSVVINKVSPVITIVPQTLDYTGSEAALSYDKGHIKVNGVSSAYQPNGSIHIQYGLSNDEWSDLGPINSGTYKVRIIYTATEDENYTNAIKIFNNAIKVLNIAPDFEPLSVERHFFTGEKAKVNFAPKIMGDEENRTLTLSYYVNGAWVSRAPTTVGTYDVRINYIAKTNDNYKSSSKVFKEHLIILPREVIVTPKLNQFKVYDGLPIENILYDAEGLIAGDSLIGALAAGVSVNAGRYDIGLGDLRIDTAGKAANYANNYEIILKQGAVYDILKAEVELEFYDIPASLLIYRPGDKKSGYVKVSAARDGKSIPVSIVIEGEETKVGSFTVKVYLQDNNYALPSVNEKTYYITAADMDEYDNIFVDKTYSYSGKTYEFGLERIFDEATVAYEYNDEIQTNPFMFINVGKYTVTATISKDNYNTITKEATLTIIKAKPIVNVLPYTDKLAYGDALPRIACDNENGTIALDKGQMLIPGTYEYNWTFNPSNEENYVSVTGKIGLTVEKATTELLVSGKNTQNASNPSRYLAQLMSSNGILQGNIDIKYYDMDGNIYSQLPSKAGRYTLVVTFSGDENYNASSYTETIIVEEKTDLTWLYILIGALAALGVVGGIISASRRRS